jgi:hypothetical protein
MSIKEKVLTSCKTSYAKYGLKKDELKGLVDQVIAGRGLTDESNDEDINGAVTAYEPIVGLMQTMYNRAIGETTKKYEGYVKPEPQPEPDNVNPPVNIEQVAKMIADAQTDNQKAISDAVSAALAPYKEREEKARLTSLLQGNEKLKDIPEVFRSRYVLDKEENLDAIAEKINNDWTALKQSMIANGSFVEAPRQSTPESEAQDFIKQMEGYAERNAPKS